MDVVKVEVEQEQFYLEYANAGATADYISVLLKVLKTECVR